MIETAQAQMLLQMEHLPEEAKGIPWVLIAFTVIAAAILAWGGVEGLKRTWLKKYKYEARKKDKAEGVRRRTTVVVNRAAKEAMWWSPMLIFLAIAIGCLVGLIAWSMSDWPTGYGVLLGGCGGSLSSYIVHKVKRRLGKLIEGAGPKPAATEPVDPRVLGTFEDE
jgi:hypothetical protein